MQELIKSPICQDSDIEVYRPSLDFFINKIKTNDFFSFTRQMHGLWDAFITSWILEPELRSIKLSDKVYIEKITKAMSKCKEDLIGAYYEPSFYSELLEVISKLDATDDSFLFGISDTDFLPEFPPKHLPYHFSIPNRCLFKHLDTKDDLKFYKVRFIDRHNIIKLLLPDYDAFFDAVIWKLYCYQNDIWEFFKTIQNHPVVLVGPAHYKSFDKMAKFTNYHHIKIHDSRASSHRQEILQTIIKKHEEFKNSELAPIYFFVAGSVSVWLVYHLHHTLENKFLIDIGQAFNMLYSQKEGMLNAGFGFSQDEKDGRKSIDIANFYGDAPFKSQMTIQDNQVVFDLDLKFSEVWKEKLIASLKLRKTRIRLSKLKYQFYNLFRND